MGGIWRQGSMARSVIIIGQSHAYCMELALSQSKAPPKDVHVIGIGAIDLKVETPAEVVTAFLPKLPTTAPDVVCLILGGNEHNALGLIEHPEPFSVGETRIGAAPAEPSRWFIPRATMLAVFEHWLDTTIRVNTALFETLSTSRRLVASPPPPLSDWGHIVAHPGIFGDRLHLGQAPAALRAELYKLQVEALRAFATSMGATFVEAPQTSKDEQGFLARAYYGRDPTHGNGTYGALMLENVIAHAEALP